MKENKTFPVSWNWRDLTNSEDDGTFNGELIRFMIRGDLYEQFNLDIEDWPIPLQEDPDHY